jgi:hypothetical protein
MIRSFVFDPARRAVFPVLFRLGRAGGLYLVASPPSRGFQVPQKETSKEIP